jgi:hypothetical protein
MGTYSTEFRVKFVNDDKDLLVEVPSASTFSAVIAQVRRWNMLSRHTYGPEAKLKALSTYRFSFMFRYDNTRAGRRTSMSGLFALAENCTQTTPWTRQQGRCYTV